MTPSAIRVAARWMYGAAKSVKDLPEGVFVGVDAMSDEIRVFFCDENGDDFDIPIKGTVEGTVEVYGPGSDTGPCMNAFIVGRAFVDKGSELLPEISLNLPQS